MSGPEPAPFAGVDPEGGLIFATTLPGSSADFARAPWDGLAAMGTPGAPVWVHLDRTKARAQAWLREASGLDEVDADALLAEETRPRAVRRESGMLVIVRGVNFNPGAEPDDMIAVRMWVEPRRIITLRQFRFMTIRALRERAERGLAPETPMAVAVAIAEGITDRLRPVIDNLLGLLDEAEEHLAAESFEHNDTAVIAEVRRQSITLRRFLAPQRDMLALLAAGETLSAPLRREVHEIADQTARVVEDLEEVRDRAQVAQDELRAQRERRASRTMYLLTLVAAIFLPLGLITGLLGINVGGMPGADDPAAFWWVTAGLVALSAALVWGFRRAGWL